MIESVCDLNNNHHILSCCQKNIFFFLPQLVSPLQQFLEEL